MKKRIIVLMLALTLLLPVTLTAGASETVMQCRLGGTYFNSLGEALKVYKEGDVIELLMELHRCGTVPYGMEVRVRGVDGVRVYDDLFYAYPHQEVQHRVEGDVHVFKLVDLEPDPSWPEVKVEEGTVPYGSMRVTGAYSWPGETVQVEVSPHTDCELTSFTVLDSEFNEIPSWRLDHTNFVGDVYYEFVLPAENLPVKVFAAIRPAGWTDEDCPSRTFTDVEEDAWYHMAVDELVRRHILNGRTLHTIEPYGTLTRAEAVTILHRLMNFPETAYAPVYTDVPEGAWYADAVSWATGEGIVNGVGNARFAPDDPLTWEQLWVMLLRLSGEHWPFFRLDTDDALKAGEVDDYAAEALSWGLENGIYAGDPIHGHTTPTRAETAVTIYLYLQNRAG